MKKSLLITVLLIFLGNLNSHAQKNMASGRIIGFKKYPIKNVKIFSKKTKNEVITDSLGHFSIACKPKDVLKINAGGFEDQNIKTKGSDPIYINLIYAETKESYNNILKGKHLKKETLDYCIENLLEDNNNYDRFQTVYDVIQYEYPNAKINNNPDSSFGVSGPQILLNAKGVSTFLGSPFALLVVDGIVVTDISGVATPQIKTLKVLTGTNAGHWGMRGGNGAVEITLKYK